MYGIFDIALDSDIPLPELPEIDTENTIICVQSGMDTNSIPEQPTWFHHWNTPKGEVYVACAKLNDSYLLRFPDLVDFIVSFTCDSVHYFQKPGVSPETIRHLLLDHVIPRVLGQLGRLVLHASAVALSNGDGIVFLGNSGWGKSTIASSFLDQGATLLTDDCLLIEVRDGQVVGIPNYYGVRLFNDSAKAIFTEHKELTAVAHYSSKKRLILQNPFSGNLSKSTRLETLYFLNDPTTAERKSIEVFKPIRGAQDMMRLVESTFILNPEDSNLIAKQFMQIGKVVQAMKNMYQLQYPRDYASLPFVLDKILAHSNNL